MYIYVFVYMYEIYIQVYFLKYIYILFKVNHILPMRLAMCVSHMHAYQHLPWTNVLWTRTHTVRLAVCYDRVTRNAFSNEFSRV